MTDFYQLPHEEQLRRLLVLAETAVQRYALPAGVSVKMINLSENATYKVEDAPGGRNWALRIHREGYHSKAAIASELAWAIALRRDVGVLTPVPVLGRDGELIQVVAHDLLPRPRNVVLFEWEAGSEPAENDIAGFEILGETAARMHRHVRSWQKPSYFERHTWDFETSLGAKPHWGRWKDGMGLTAEITVVFQKAVDLIETRLLRYGKGPERFDLIHCDMRLANLLMDGRTVKAIDFDDCGFSWLMYDCATTVSFSSTSPRYRSFWPHGSKAIGA